MAVQSDCAKTCENCCRQTWETVRDFIYTSPIIVAASLITAIALQIFMRPIAAPFWAYFAASTGVRFIVKLIDHYRIIDLSQLVRTSWNLNNNYPALQPMLLLAAVICCSFSPIVGIVIGALIGTFQGIFTHAEVIAEQLDLNTQRKKLGLD